MKKNDDDGSPPSSKKASWAQRQGKGLRRSSKDEQGDSIPRTYVGFRGLRRKSDARRQSQHDSAAFCQSRPSAALRGLRKNSVGRSAVAQRQGLNEEEIAVVATESACQREEEGVDSRGLLAEGEDDGSAQAEPGSVPAPQPQRDDPVNITTDSLDIPSYNATSIASTYHNANDALVEAMPVPPSGLELSEALAVDPTELEQRAYRARKAAECRRVGYALIAISLSTIIIAVGVHVGTRSDGPTPTQLPTSTPSIDVPSSAPTILFDELFLALPDYTKKRLTIPDSPQSQAFDWFHDNHEDILEYQNITHLPLWRQKQVFALATFFFATQGPEWIPDRVRGDWLQWKSECYWFSRSFGYVDTLYKPIWNGSQVSHHQQYEGSYVPSDTLSESCDENGKFQHLNISLTSAPDATIPPELSMITSLSSIFLSGFVAAKGNYSSEFLPTELGLLEHLTTLDLSFNELGALPSQLGLFSGLEELNLRASGISGTIPSQLGLLTQMTRIDLELNDLSGSVPSQLGRLRNLQYLDLGSNQLSGTLPTELGAATSLTQLSLIYNALTGPLPSEAGAWRNMQYFFINSNNAFSGAIPSELGHMSQLEILQIGGLSFEGPVPSELGLMTNLQAIGICCNSLTGRVPTELGQLTLLTSLWLSDNALTGAVPSEIGSLTNMKTEMKLDANLLTGAMPSQIGLLRNLTHMEMQDNLLSGRLPSELGMLENIYGCRLENNAISGVPPTTPSCHLFGNNASLYIAGDNVPDHITEIDLPGVWYAEGGGLIGTIPSLIGLLTNLKRISLQDNSLSGSLPTQFGLLTKLEEVSLQDNSLSGSLPTQFGLLTKLEEVSLEANVITDPLPRQLGYLTSLMMLSASGNGISGALPSELSSMESMERLYLHKNNLTGEVPTEIGLMSNVTVLYLRNNSLSGALPSEIWQLTNLAKLDLSNLPLLAGDIPDAVPTTLGMLDISGSNLGGNLSEAWCYLQNSSCTYMMWGWDYPCELAFDCNAGGLICGCDCPCLGDGGNGTT